jgi:hypothetical protein
MDFTWEPKLMESLCPPRLVLGLPQTKEERVSLHATQLRASGPAVRGATILLLKEETVQAGAQAFKTSNLFCSGNRKDLLGMG